MDGRHRGGGDAARPAGWSLAHRIDGLLPELSQRLAGSVSAETHACTELATGVHDRARRHGRAYTLRAALAEELEPLGLSGRGRDPPAGPRPRGGGVRRRPLPAAPRGPARACAARADLRPPRARGRADPQLAIRGRPPARTPCRSSSPCRPTRRSGGATPTWPRCAPRCSRASARGGAAPLRQLRDLRRAPSTCCCAPGLPRTDVRLVRRPAAAPLRHGRGAGSRRPDGVAEVGAIAA